MTDRLEEILAEVEAEEREAEAARADLEQRRREAAEHRRLADQARARMYAPEVLDTEGQHMGLGAGGSGSPISNQYYESARRKRQERANG